ncbi:N-acetylglucosamine-1-phosphodiester alpha-N-acetylglucosaminidase [Balamuthia mandrillaris]
MKGFRVVALLLFAGLLLAEAQLVKQQSQLHQLQRKIQQSFCISLGVESEELCAKIALDDTCHFNVTLTAGKTQIFDKSFYQQLPPSMQVCAPWSEGCDLCLRFNNLVSQTEPACMETALSCFGVELSTAELGCVEGLSAGLRECVKCPQGCSEHGICENGVCRCDEGWTGEACSQAKPELLWHACPFGGIIGLQNLCLDISYASCELILGVVFRGLDIFGQSISLAEMLEDPTNQFCVEPIDGCEICASVPDFTLDKNTHLASGCPALAGNCFGMELPGDTYALPCFEDSQILGECVGCPNDCTAPNGECVDGHCKCKDDWIGLDCSYKDCPHKCSEHGRCVRGFCLCDEGWSGIECSIPCTTSPTDTMLISEQSQAVILKKGQPAHFFITTEEPLGSLSFTFARIDAGTSLSLHGWLRESCQAGPAFYDADFPTTSWSSSDSSAVKLFNALEDCPPEAEKGGRWYFNLTCSETSASDSTCRVRVTPHVRTIQALGSTPHEAFITPEEVHYYSITSTATGSGQFLVLNISQAPTSSVEEAKRKPLGLIAVERSRCPLQAEAQAATSMAVIKSPTSQSVQSGQQGTTYVSNHYDLLLANLTRGEYFIRVAGPASSTSVATAMRYTIQASLSSSYCSEPCQNEGACAGLNTCLCPKEWAGHLCELPRCDLPCEHGVCTAYQTCKCEDGWTGSQCNHRSSSSNSPSRTSLFFLGAITMGGIVLVAALGGGAYVWYRRRKASRLQADFLEMEESFMSAANFE